MWAIVLIHVAVIAAIFFLVDPILFPLDDAYITLNNSRVLLEGTDRSFGVSPLVGATSLLHLGALALAGLLLPLEYAALILNGLASVAYSVGLVFLFLPLRLRIVSVVSLTLIGIFSANVPYHLFNGLETSLAMAAVVLCLILMHRQSQTALPLLCGILPFVRPELAALSVGIILHRAVLLRQAPWQIATDIGLVFIAATPLALWMWMETGSLVPSTSNAKAAFFAEEGYPASFKAGVVALVTLQSGLFVILLGVVFLWRWPYVWGVWFFVAAFILVLGTTFPGGLAHNYHRYLYPLVPIGLLGWATILANRERAKWLLSVLVMFHVATINVSSLVGGRYTAHELKAATDWMNANLSSNAVVLIHDAGMVAWATDFALVDLVGLKTPSSVSYHLKWTLPSRGEDRWRAVHEIALAANPTHSVFLSEGFWAENSDYLLRAGWTLEPLRIPAEGRGYVVYALAPPAN